MGVVSRQTSASVVYFWGD